MSTSEFGGATHDFGGPKPCDSRHEWPKVAINKQNDMALKPAGKRCAAAGLPNLPGGVMRCHSMPGRALTCPSGWLAEELSRCRHQSNQHQETLRATSSQAHSVHNGSWPDLQSSLRPNTVAVERVPGGGRTQGARSMRPMTEGSMSYAEFDPAKHGWHDPRGQMEQTRLCDPSQGRSWAWTMRKARDHTGYGIEGMPTHGDIQGTAVSGDGPDWFVGPKTVTGPFSTKTVPTRRCPVAQIDGQTMRLRGKTYEHPGNLQITETLHDGNKVPEKSRRARPAHPMDAFNKAKHCSLIHGGCQTKPEQMFLSRHVIREGRTQKL
jgi:hypothetical protein